MFKRWEPQGAQWGGEYVCIMQGEELKQRVCITSFSDDHFNRLIRESYDNCMYDENDLFSVCEDAQYADFVRLACDLNNSDLDTLRAFLAKNLQHPMQNLAPLLNDMLYFEDERVVLFPRLVLNSMQWEQFARAHSGEPFSFFRSWTHPMMTRASSPTRGIDSVVVDRVGREQIYSLFPSRKQIRELDLCATPLLPPLRLTPITFAPVTAVNCVYASNRAVLTKDGNWYHFGKQGTRNRVCLKREEQADEWLTINFPSGPDFDTLPTYECYTEVQKMLLRHAPARTTLAFGRLFSPAFYGSHWCASQLPTDFSYFCNARQTEIPFYVGSGGVTLDWMVVKFWRAEKKLTDTDMNAILSKVGEYWRLYYSFSEQYPFYEEVYYANRSLECYVHFTFALTPSQWRLFTMCIDAAAEEFNRNKKKNWVRAFCMNKLPVMAAELPTLHLAFPAGYLRCTPLNDITLSLEASVCDDVAHTWDVDALLRAFDEDTIDINLVQFTSQWLTYKTFGVRRGFNEYYVKKEGEAEEYVVPITEENGLGLPVLPVPQNTQEVSWMMRSIGTHGLVKLDKQTGEYKSFRTRGERYFSMEGEQLLARRLNIVRGEEKVRERLDANEVELYREGVDLYVTEVTGSTGAGKTTMIRKLAARWVQLSSTHLVLFVSPRVGINEQVYKSFQEEGLAVAYYKHDIAPDARVLVTTSHSLHRFVGDHDSPFSKAFVNHEEEQNIMMIMDEATTIFLEDLLSVEFLRPDRFEKALADILPCANLKQLVLVDANLDPLVTENVLQRVRYSLDYHIGVPLVRLMDVRIDRHCATFSMVEVQQREAYVFNNELKFNRYILELLRDGEKVAMFCSVKANMRVLEQYFRSELGDEYVVWAVCADSKPTDWSRFTAAIENNRVSLLLYTTVASAGIDITFTENNCYFTYVALHDLDSAHLSFMQLYQAASRVRNTSSLLIYSEQRVNNPFQMMKVDSFRNLLYVEPLKFVETYLSKATQFNTALDNAKNSSIVMRAHNGHLVPHLTSLPLPERVSEPRLEHPFAVSYAMGYYYKYLSAARLTFVVSLLLKVGYPVFQFRERMEIDLELAGTYADTMQQSVLRASRSQQFGVSSPERNLQNTTIPEEAMLAKQVAKFSNQLVQFNRERDRLQLPRIVFPTRMGPGLREYALGSVIPSVEFYLNKLDSHVFITLDVLGYLCRENPTDAIQWKRCITQILDVYQSKVLSETSRPFINNSLDAASRGRDRGILAAYEIYCAAAMCSEGPPPFLPDILEENVNAVRQLPDPRKLSEEGLVEMIYTPTYCARMSELITDMKTAFYDIKKHYNHFKDATPADLYALTTSRYLRLPGPKRQGTKTVNHGAYNEIMWLRAMFYLWREHRAERILTPATDTEDLQKYVACAREFKLRLYLNDAKDEVDYTFDDKKTRVVKRKRRD